MVVRDPLVRALLVVMLLIAAVYLTGLLWQAAAQFSDVILLFFLAWMISFILEPLVGLLTVRARLRRGLAVLAAYLAVLIVASLAVLQLLPRLSAQTIQVVNDLPTYAAWTNAELLRLQALLAHQGIQVAPDSLLNYQEVVRHVETLGPSLVANTVGLATSLASVLFQVFIILILSYYMTLDGQRITDGLLLALPGAYREDAHYFLSSVNRAFAGFIRGQLAQAAVYGLGTAIVMSAADLKLTLLSSVACSLLMLIPFVGPILGLALPVFIAAVSRPDALWPVAISLFVLQQIVINVVAPRLMSQTVGLHPLLVFFAVLGGAKVAGVWGAFFGVPVVAVATAMASFYYATVRDRQTRLGDGVWSRFAERQAEPAAPSDDDLPATMPGPGPVAPTPVPYAGRKEPPYP